MINLFKQSKSFSLITFISQVTAAIKRMEGNLLAQLGDSFKNLVETLSAMEQGEIPPDNTEVREETGEIETKNNEQKASESEDLITFPSVVNELNTNTSHLPVLIQLTNNWPGIVASILGDWPFQVFNSDGLESTMKSIDSGETCSLDTLVQSLLIHPNESVLLSFVETIIGEMNKYSTDMFLQTILNSETPTASVSSASVAFLVGLKFLRSVVRQMSVHLSKSHLSYIDLRTRVGGNTGGVSLRSTQGDSATFRRKTRLVCTYNNRKLEINSYRESSDQFRLCMLDPKSLEFDTFVILLSHCWFFPNFTKIRLPSVETSHT